MDSSLPLVLMANRILLIAKLWRTGINSLIFILRSFFEYVPTYQRGLIQQNQALKLTRLQRNYVEIGDLFLRKSGSSAACFFSVSCMAQLAVKDFGGIFHQSNCNSGVGPWIMKLKRKFTYASDCDLPANLPCFGIAQNPTELNQIDRIEYSMKTSGFRQWCRCPIDGS